MAVRGNVKPADAKLHTTEPVYHANDIALGVTYQIAVGEKRSIAIQTHVTRDCEPTELDALLDKVVKATDRIEAKYRLKELRVLKAQHTKQFAATLEDYSVTQKRWENAWQASGRRGPFKPDGTQESTAKQSLVMQDRLKKEITAIDVEIATLESVVGN